MITPLPGATPLVPGSCTLPLPGITAAIVDETGNDVPNGAGGILVIKRPWPSMIRTIWGDPERFKKSYFPEELKGYYLAGDGAVRSADRGYFRITGRIDDVLNVSGHRMGTMEIESALVAKTDLVAEAAVVGRPDDLTGEAICAFVVLKRSRPPATKPTRSPRSCATGWPRKSAPSPSPRTSASATTCPRRARARSCAACCARWPRASRSPGHQHAGKPGDPGPVGQNPLRRCERTRHARSSRPNAPARRCKCSP
jgi:acetyl-CoA synthetase